jgi:YihY family inner membrane protein
VNPIEGAARRVDRVQQSHMPTAFTFGVMKKYGDDNAGSLVANLAFSAVLATFPLLLILVTVLGLVLSDHPAWKETVLHSAFAEFPVIGRQLGSNIHPLHNSSVAGLVIGLLGLLWGSIGLAQAGLFAMAQIWNVPGSDRPNYPKRLLRGVIFLGVLGVGLALSGWVAGVATYGGAGLWSLILREALAVVINFALYVTTFRALTPKTVATRSLLPGAALGAVAWTVLLALGGYLVGHDLQHDSAVYGVFGMVLGLLAWIYLGAEITVYAAEVNTVLFHHLWPRAMVQPPLTDADRRSIAFQATQNRRRPEEHVRVGFTDPAGADENGPEGSEPDQAPGT